MSIKLLVEILYTNASDMILCLPKDIGLSIEQLL